MQEMSNIEAARSIPAVLPVLHSSQDAGYRCISADRLMAAQAQDLGLRFEMGGQEIPAVVVFSPVMFMPAVADVLQELVSTAFDSSEVLGVVRNSSPLGLLGEEADIAVIDGSPAGVIRASFLESAWRQALCVKEGHAAVDLMSAVEAFIARRIGAVTQPNLTPTLFAS